MQTASPSLPLAEWSAAISTQEMALRLGGGAAAIERQHAKGRLTARERIDRLIDPGTSPLELGIFAGHEMYDRFGGAPAAGVITTIGMVAGRRQMIIANDATVKAGAFFPATCKKVLRAQRIAFACKLPLIYLVDSAGVFLPLQEDVFPDEDDFGRIFRNNAVISAAGIPQLAAIMGSCVAGGGYLPVLCDKLLMTEGSGLYLAGPALVKSAIGQEISSDELGGAKMHASISGTIDYREANDEQCLARLRSLVGQSAPDRDEPVPPFSKIQAQAPARQPTEIYTLVDPSSPRGYDMRQVLETIVDAATWNEFKAEYGPTILCGTARIGGYAVGIVASQKSRAITADGQLQLGGVIYVDAAEKAARFVMSCNQDQLPIIFLQDTTGFMVGRDSEHAGIIKAGAKLVSAVSNSRVPKITVLVGGSYGAGSYALCGKAFDPRLIFAWPSSKLAVMGAHQATQTLVDITANSQKKNRADEASADTEQAQLAQLREEVRASYERQLDARYAAARGWVDAIIDPARTRDVLIESLAICTRTVSEEPYKLGVFQV
ncbi:Propionyl-CoA carboxylase [Pirellula staleyi DSM 6068]|uniref:Propionyl-CoA carboxylase n=1 Tax=Pirellula staleyi (strain ATCC 27377 / DSM 6068 / ICPB 4128) TaxID=530564 RepID=D2R0B7_PIRSD|nr:acyl-CoA carboxylase subunit beta [Pirellula staleyi]ADB14785.1 Propionyl-CoA carboxylase [Pirellula staleyi DSM 6068]